MAETPGHTQTGPGHRQPDPGRHRAPPGAEEGGVDQHPPRGPRHRGGDRDVPHHPVGEAVRGCEQGQPPEPRHDPPFSVGQGEAVGAVLKMYQPGGRQGAFQPEVQVLGGQMPGGGGVDH